MLVYLLFYLFILNYITHTVLHSNWSNVIFSGLANETGSTFMSCITPCINFSGNITVILLQCSLIILYVVMNNFVLAEALKYKEEIL